ncbi:MAG TPA: hypothetical protein VGN68_12990 [Sphingopyxis sp.]|uniref:phosphoribosyltransferase-like protein n=1 Tax=Sphingopyxis sp. TaxID=1908224 RepID=UPI002E13AB55|nr:hypothetical protein [Sphingopyxis sp.]
MTEQEIRKFLFRILVANDSFDGLDSELFDLFAGCESESEYALISHVIEKMVIVKENKLSNLLESMAQFIKDKKNELNNYCVVAAAWDEDADSSQAVIHQLKSHLVGFGDIKFFNSVPQYLKKDRISLYPNFTLIDEFSGTGNTIINRVKHIKKHADSLGIQVNPSVFMLAGMQNALSFVKTHISDCEFAFEIKPGISGYFSGDELDLQILNMKKLEGYLSPNVDGNPLPSLGHGEAEAMFCIKRWNAPNSNFPILWWPKDKLQNDRSTVMKRLRP